MEFETSEDIFTLETPRLILRGWQESDMPLWIDMNSDPQVREYFPGILTEEEAIKQAHQFHNHIVAHGFGFWAAEARVPLGQGIEPGQFLGFIGLDPTDSTAPSVEEGPIAYEIGWRLRKDAWGFGLATEGARAVRDYAFGVERLPIIGAMAVGANVRSTGVMEKIGMTFARDFSHPEIDSPCVFYTMNQSQWRRLRPSED